MLNIAICDDESAIQSQIEKFIREAFPENVSAHALKLAGYSSGAELCATV